METTNSDICTFYFVQRGLHIAVRSTELRDALARWRGRSMITARGAGYSYDGSMMEYVDAMHGVRC
eukprot:scaffold633274_cov23-Prasinocladus_malaysianus.AAC.2